MSLNVKTKQLGYSAIQSLIEPRLQGSWCVCHAALLHEEFICRLRAPAEVALNRVNQRQLSQNV